jgi:hypothetical protein
LFEHSLAHSTPDACFPNNWFSTHPVGEASGGLKKSTLVLYPMKVRLSSDFGTSKSVLEDACFGNPLIASYFHDAKNPKL